MRVLMLLSWESWVESDGEGPEPSRLLGPPCNSNKVQGAHDMFVSERELEPLAFALPNSTVAPT